MFEVESRLNEFLLKYFKDITRDIPEGQALHPAGRGHCPLWIYGHLALCVGIGNSLIGGENDQQHLMATFGPGSSGEVGDAENVTGRDLIKTIVEGYPALAKSAMSLTGDQMAGVQQPHGIPFLAESAIETKAHLLSHLLTTHLSFHLAQLSVWRRENGAGPLF